MIIQNKDNKITIISETATELLPIHKELGYELMPKPDFDVRTKLHLVDGVLKEDTQEVQRLDQAATHKEQKAQKLKALKELTVTTEAGNTFDADDQSRANMNEAITAAAVLGLTESPWKLHDNSVVTISVDEIKEALALGIVEKGAIVLG